MTESVKNQKVDLSGWDMESVIFAETKRWMVIKYVKSITNYYRKNLYIQEKMRCEMLIRIMKLLLKIEKWALDKCMN